MLPKTLVSTFDILMVFLVGDFEKKMNPGHKVFQAYFN